MRTINWENSWLRSGIKSNPNLSSLEQQIFQSFILSCHWLIKKPVQALIRPSVFQLFNCRFIIGPLVQPSILPALGDSESRGEGSASDFGARLWVEQMNVFAQGRQFGYRHCYVFIGKFVLSPLFINHIYQVVIHNLSITHFDMSTKNQLKFKAPK